MDPFGECFQMGHDAVDRPIAIAPLGRGANCLKRYTPVAGETTRGFNFTAEKGENPLCFGVGLIEEIDSRGSQGFCVAAGGPN
jgi:hypothetical protein